MSKWLVGLALTCACGGKSEEANKRCTELRQGAVQEMASHKKGLTVEVEHYKDIGDFPSSTDTNPWSQRLDKVQQGIMAAQKQRGQKHHAIQVKLMAADDAAAAVWNSTNDPAAAMKSIDDLEAEDAAAENEELAAYKKLKPDADSLVADASAASQPNKNFIELATSSKKLIDDNLVRGPAEPHTSDSFYFTEFQQKCQKK